MVNAGTEAKKTAREASLVWLGSIALTGVFGLLAMVVPFVAENLLAFVAATFLYLPAAALWRRQRDLAEYGLRADPILKGVALFFVVTLIVMPPFALGHRYWQQFTSGRAPELTRERLVRFDRELDDRPDLSAETSGLYTWIEQQRLMLLWTEDAPVSVRIQVETRDAKADPFPELTGLTLKDGKLLGGSRGRTQVENGDTLVWSRPNAGGLGFRVRGVESIRVETNTGTLKTGRYAVAQESPLQTSRSPWWWAIMFMTQLILVAVPEEWFYRGYLQQRLHEAWGTPWRVLGAQMGAGWIVSSVLFALGHLVLDPRPSRLAVFFPSLLFGWMKTRTGSILAPSLFHALSNVWIQGLNYVYLG